MVLRTKTEIVYKISALPLVSEFDEAEKIIVDFAVTDDACAVR